MRRWRSLGRSTRKYLRKKAPSPPASGPPQLRQITSRSGTFGEFPPLQSGGPYRSGDIEQSEKIARLRRAADIAMLSNVALARPFAAPAQQTRYADSRPTLHTIVKMRCWNYPMTQRYAPAWLAATSVTPRRKRSLRSELLRALSDICHLHVVPRSRADSWPLSWPRNHNPQQSQDDGSVATKKNPK